MELPENVFDYLALPTQERINLFLKTNTHTNKPATYYIDFDTVDDRVNSDLTRLNRLTNELDPHSIKDVTNYFANNSDQITLIPLLLAIRTGSTLGVQGLADQDSDYILDYQHPQKTIDEHLRFIKDSGLAQFLVNNPISNFTDLARGIEIGINTNARKNRGGSLGENFLDQQLSRFATRVKPDKSSGKTVYTPLSDDLSFVNQGTIKVMQDAFNLDLSHSKIPKNRRFDGAVYQKSTNHLALLEINFFNSGGSKLKSVAGEFTDLQSALADADFQFIYITSGAGWAHDLSHISSAIEKIKYLFNFEMVKKGYVEQLLTAPK